jgi:hypothetical protein
MTASTQAGLQNGRLDKREMEAVAIETVRDEVKTMYRAMLPAG